MDLLPARHTRWRRVLAAASAVLVLLGVGALVTGRVGYVVTDGVSMEPLYHTGDLVVIAKASSYHVGEIVAYYGDLDGHVVVLHRIVGGNASSGFRMKGDNNHSIDPVHPKASEVIGRAVLHIPKVGAFITSPVVRGLLILVIAIMLASLVFDPLRRSAVASPGGSSLRPERQTASHPRYSPMDGAARTTVSPLFGPSKPGPGPRTVGTPLHSSMDGAGRTTVSPLFRSSRPGAGTTAVSTLERSSMPVTTSSYRIERPGTLDLSHAAEVPSNGGSRRGIAAWKVLLGVDAVLGIALVATLLVGSPAPAPAPAALTQTGGLTYQARAPRTATYPTGHIVTGDPVFVKLVDHLGVSYFYSTSAAATSVRGTAQLEATISASSGWQDTFQLVKPSPLVAGRAHLTARLDLARLQAIAEGVSTATSVYTGTLSLTVAGISNVSFDGAKPVERRVELLLSLSPLEVTMSDGATTPTPYGPAIVSTTALNTVPPAHKASSLPHLIRLGLLVALLLLIAITFVAIPESEPDDRRSPHSDR